MRKVKSILLKPIAFAKKANVNKLGTRAEKALNKQRTDNYSFHIYYFRKSQMTIKAVAWFT